MVETTLYITIILLSFCSILAIIRFIKGPTLPDRVTAFDLFAAIVISLIAIYAVISGNTAFIDVAILLSLITFLGSMSFAYFLFRSKKNK
ncbi:MAG TPA: monovalent cation/H+ antiporter complex subunit F [Tenuifilaceae bacterium]|jgi:multicomponent Na+:H+ antiporter subunit F|nr:monovalent cation/H+ antiporter complex subunit F [Tenuifilaceae bacterium]